MIALQIVDLKDFMSKLLIGSTFDSFWLCEASVTTFATFTIDGTLHRLLRYTGGPTPPDAKADLFALAGY